MHRNTYLLVTVLAVFAALVVGVNLGRKFSTPAAPTPQAVTTTAPTPTPTPLPHPVSYVDAKCGFTFDYPSNLQKVADASGSAILVDPATKKQIIVTCQQEIPRVPLPPEKIDYLVIESASTSATMSAQLYHDASQKDGTPIDKLIFRNFRTGYDIFIAGLGPVFDALVRSVKLYP